MKLWHCDWVPSSVADWLCRELDERGIPGTTYTRTVLSLLHPYFCPHPVPKVPSPSSKYLLEPEDLLSIFDSRQPRGFEDLYEELENYVHPDADFPDLNITEHIKEGTRRSKKRQKRKLQELTLTSEKLWKFAALQCLLTSSDEHQDLNAIVEELFSRLKSASETRVEKEADATVSDQFDQQFEASCTADKNCESNCSSDIKDINTSYGFDFPPLTLPAENTAPTLETVTEWKNFTRNNLNPTEDNITACDYASECAHEDSRPFRKDVKRNLQFEFDKVQDSVDKPAMDIWPDKCSDKDEFDSYTSCLAPHLPEESSIELYNSEQSRLGNGIRGNILVRADSPTLSSCAQVDTVSSEKERMEEWECATAEVLLSQPDNESCHEDLFGNRLFERSVVMGSVRCGSDATLDSLEEEKIKCEERNVPNLATQVWGLTSELIRDSLSDAWPSHHTDTASADILNPSFIHDNSNILGCRRERECDNTKHSSSEFPPVTRKLFMHQVWESLDPVDHNRDSLFGAFRACTHTTLQEGTGQDYKFSLSDISNENIKNIWSDCNDNDISVNAKATVPNIETSPSATSDVSIDRTMRKDVSDEELCDSFRQLGLEHLWQDTIFPENSRKEMSENFSSAASSANFFEDPMGVSLDIHREHELSTENLFQNKELSNSLQLPNIPSGPSGPYVELKHTESSGFSAVVPHKSADGTEEDCILHEKEVTLTPMGTKIAEPSDSLQSHEEENLLTSPRTHFRPIRQDSRGSALEGKSERGRNVAGIENSDLIFQRTDSGTLFLESDTLEGSPKKYMVYREPEVKSAYSFDPASSQEAVLPLVKAESESVLSSFVPKFKIINNEKFCQTEEEYLASLGHKLDLELQSNILHSDLQHDPYKEDSSEKLWNLKCPEKLKQLWDNGPVVESKEAWELDLTNKAVSHSKWPTSDCEFNLADWKTAVNRVQTPPAEGSYSSVGGSVFSESAFDRNSNVDDINNLSKIKFIWHDSVEKSIHPTIESSAPASLSVSRDFGLCEKDPINNTWRSLSDDDRLTYVKESEGKFNVTKNPWNVDLSLQKKEVAAERTSLQVQQKHEHPSLWQLQQEVDQEADEILGGLIPSSPLKMSPSYNSENVTNQNESDDFNFLDFLVGQEQQQPVEDLDHLEPGWDLNEGFEWGPAIEEDEDDDSGREILIYENEDGQTVMVPIEYLDDSLYDEIFGSERDTPIGGSLPDLPQGHIGEWKKLSRRTRGGRFVPPSRRPCSFFLEGNCRRSDCKFSHDLLTITCRFWEEGSCLKGETCPFRHGFLPSRRRNRSEGDQFSLSDHSNFSYQKESTNGMTKGRLIPKRNRGCAISAGSFEIDSETDFPCLGSSAESKNGSLDEKNFPANVKGTKLSKKKKKFIAVTKSLLKDSENDLKSSYATKSVRKAERRKHKTSKNQQKSSLNMFEDSEDKNLAQNRKEKLECESLRKILRKRATAVPSRPLFSDDDGTVSDF